MEVVLKIGSSSDLRLGFNDLSHSPSIVIELATLLSTVECEGNTITTVSLVSSYTFFVRV